MVVVTPSKAVQCSLVGDGMVGKTSLAKLFVGENLQKTYVATVEDYFTGNVSAAGDKYSIDIIDSAGQHDYENIRKQGYKDGDVFIVCYSAVDRESLDSVQQFWLPEIKATDKKRPIILVATQTDLRTEDSDHISHAEGNCIAKQIDASCFLECSTTQKDSVKDVFVNAVMATLKRRKRRSSLIKRVFAI